MPGFLFPLLLTVHVLVGISVVGLVLLQHGKGADMGAAFGSGASGSLFGATGSANFLSRLTAALATVFFITSLLLTYMASNKPKAPTSVMDAVVQPEAAPAKAEVPVPAKTDVPAVPAKAEVSAVPAKTEAPAAASAKVAAPAAAKTAAPAAAKTAAPAAPASASKAGEIPK
jgi:preprotein translocase subunit SecG